MDSLWRGLIGNFFGVRPPSGAPAEEVRERRSDKRAASSIEVTLQWEDSRGEVRTVQGMLENVSEYGFAIRTKSRMREGQTVWVTRPDSPALKSVVRHVSQENETYVLGFARIVLERRREDRRPVAGSALLRRSGPRGETLAVDVEIRNISPEGVQVAAPESVPKNEVARLIGTAVECMGTVRYCVPWNGKFLVGVFLIGKAHRKSNEEPVYH